MRKYLNIETFEVTKQRMNRLPGKMQAFEPRE